MKTGTLHLPIVIEQDEDNFYIVSCTVSKGCHAYGITIEDALKNIREVREDLEITIDEFTQQWEKHLLEIEFIE